ncbi:SMP-30/gluconolactonase/LRE family protein [Paraburkholderia caribensis]|uniref:SMP-30/gluconolactonase/LRE family protein n=2 Tax=Paraburkholderia caribensis TaxID=75105 RepID=A0ABV0DQF2_9BURK|nr:SMP-30/gluconolactonase/LRE family protein [Paraburkholderia caribensis]MCO4881482.1 SMP-30/gluconolactonase/LRE family protein [Paraburkholderia caribensis]
MSATVDWFAGAPYQARGPLRPLLTQRIVIMQTLECVLPAAAALGECPRWDERRAKLWWVDINAPALNSFDPKTGENSAIPMPENIGCFSLTEDDGFIAGMRTGIFLLDAKGQVVRKLCANAENPATSRFNDGRCDARGRFWLGTLDEPKAGDSAALYRYANGALTKMDAGLLTSNGMAFSPDYRWCYHSDTPRFTIYRHPYDIDSGEVGPREDWVKFQPTPTDRGRPDGASVDSEGYYWSALYEGGRVVRISPEGKVVEEHPLPARCPTMCAFGGDDLRTLYVTTARQGRPAEEIEQYPQSGGVFAMRVSVPGLIEKRSALRVTQ